MSEIETSNRREHKPKIAWGPVNKTNTELTNHSNDVYYYHSNDDHNNYRVMGKRIDNHEVIMNGNYPYNTYDVLKNAKAPNEPVNKPNNGLNRREHKPKNAWGPVNKTNTELTNHSNDDYSNYSVMGESIGPSQYPVKKQNPGRNNRFLGKRLQ